MAAPRSPQGDFRAQMRQMQKRLDSLDRQRIAGVASLATDKRDIPSPPMGVTYENFLAGDTPAIRTTWTEPTTNTDGSELTDLWGYQVQQQIGMTVSWEDPDAVAPAKPDQSLNRLFNRAGMGDGWTGGDGGASHRDNSGKDWWFWSDSTWGSINSKGATEKWFMLRNSISSTVGKDPNSMEMFTGFENWFTPGRMNPAGWVSNGAAPTAIPDGLHWEPGAANRYVTHPVASRMPVEPGETVTASVRLSVPGARLEFTFRNSSGGFLASWAIPAVEDEPITSISRVAPAGAARASVAVLSSSTEPIDITHLYLARGEARMASWRRPVRDYQFTNIARNPEGSGKYTSTDTTVAWRNYALDPSAESPSNPSVATLYSSATLSRTTSASAYVGQRTFRVNRNVAGNGSLIQFDDSNTSPSLTLGDVVTFRLRIRRGSLASSTSRLSGQVMFWNSAGTAVAPHGAIRTFDVNSDWTVETFDGQVPSGATRAGIILRAEGTAWSASDWFEVDGREYYVGTVPATYFDGSTPDGDGWAYRWEGNPHDSVSVMEATSVQRRNLALNPLPSTLDGWAGANGAAVRLDASSVPSGGVGVLLPAVTNPGVLDSVRALLATPSAVVGIGVNSDSTAETTGSQSNPDLSDRWMETLQRELRRAQQSPDVRIDPEGYYGATAYVSARYQHNGPIDWEVRGPSSNVSDMGPSGRAVALPYGSSVHGRAVFDSAILEIPKHTYGRIAVVSVDGVEKARLDTYGTLGEMIQWDTGSLGYGEHLISVESSRNPNLPDGDVRVSGAQLFDEANRSRGTRVYDLSQSGRALFQHVAEPQVLEAGLMRPMHLMVWSLDFNDAGSGVTPAQHKANLKTILQRQRNLGYTGKNLIVSKWDPAASVTATWPAQMSAYRQAMREVALEEPDTAFIDLGEVMPPVDEDNSLYDDWLHPNEIGQQRIAAVMRGVILGQSSSNSVLVKTDAASEAAVFTGWAAGAFNNRKTFTWSAKVQGPAGRQVRARVKVPGMADDTSAVHTFTGGWDDLAVTAEVSMAATAATPAVWVEQADSGGAMLWRVAEVLTEEGLVAGEFFYSGTPDTESIDFGVLSNGESVARSYLPMLWSASDGRVEYDPTVKHDFGGSVKFTPFVVLGSHWDMLFDTSNGYSGDVTVAYWQYAEVGMETAAFSLERDSSGVIHQGDFFTYGVLAGGEWKQFRGTITPAAGRTVVGVRFMCGGVSLDSSWTTEVTAVAGSYDGPTFSGGSKGSHATSVWEGAPGLSRSVLTLGNTSYAEDMTQHTSLISAEAAGLEGWKFLWCQGAIGLGDTAVMFLQTFYHRPMLDESGWNFERWGDIVVAKFDLASQRLLDVSVLVENSPVQWGEALWVDEGTLYCYGQQDKGDGTSEVMLCRWPAAAIEGDLLWSDVSVWTGQAWGPPALPPGPVANPPVSNFSAVRKLGDRWVALNIGGFESVLMSWEATSPTGPFIESDVVYSFPAGDGINRYVPRFHPQFDTGEHGVSMGVCESGGGKYGPTFLLGPSGTRIAGFGDAYWGNSRLVEDPEHIEPDIEPGTPYRVRVRALDTAGNMSEWAVGEEAWAGGEYPAVPRPSIPIVSSFFRGGRAFWDGLDENGDQYEGFEHYEVHLNKGGAEFDPNNWTRVDSSIVAGGITPITVDDYSTYYVGIIVVTSAGRSAMSLTAPFQPERLSDPDLGQTLIDGARLKPGTVNASALTVGSFTDNLLPNANFEQPSLADLTKPSMWAAGWPRGDRDWNSEDWDSAGTWERTETDPISGSASLKLTTTEDTWRQVLSNPPIPVQPGDIYYVAARVRTDGIDGDIDINLLLGETEEDVNAFGTTKALSLLVGSTAGGQSTQLVEGPVEVPDLHGDGSGVAMRFAAVAVEAKATGRAYTTWIDNVDVKRVVGEAAIADASINRAKIRYLAVDDARIASVGVGKLVAGELFADITVSARIMTSKTGKRTEMNRDGFFGFNPDLTGGNDQIPVTEIRSSDAGVVSRWIRTNSAGTRIEMGTYTMGQSDPNKAALISFFPSAGTWQFPPAFGFGGESRRPQFPGDTTKVPGLAIHAGSQSQALYDKHGMNMFSVDQAGGIIGVTGNRLDTSEADDGAPIRFNAGGSKGYIELLSGGVSSTDPARLVLDPDVGSSYLALNKGGVRFANVGPNDSYRMEFVYGEDWLDYNHLLIQIGGGGLRVGSSADPNAFIFKSGDLTLNNGEVYANSFRGPGNTEARITTIDGAGMIRFDGAGNPYKNSTGGTRATSAFWVNDAGLMEGGGDWGTPKIKVRAQDSYISWDNLGNAYIDGQTPPIGPGEKTFVIQHPVVEDKFLVHAVAEGPTADVFYRGSGRLLDGEVTVVLPDYFEALTVPHTATVQVTLIADDLVSFEDPAVLGVSRVEGGKFRVYCLSGDRWAGFFWEVKAERAGTGFDVEPDQADVEVVGVGPYRYIKS